MPAMERTAAYAAAVSAPGVAGGAQLADYIALLKPRVMSLVVFSGFAGLYLAPGTLHPILALTAILCIAIGAGASGAINMWYDRDIDGVMERTRGRPLPMGRLEPGEALGFGITLAVGSVAVMVLAVNWVAAAWLAATIAFYVFVYTMWLKRRTPQNIVIGGAAGAFPPIIGWAAVTGSVGIEALVLFGIIFMWTPPHFWALALFRSDDYGRAGVPMLPNVAGAAETKRQILLYTVLLFPIAMLPTWLGFASHWYGLAAAVMGILFIVCALRVRQDTHHRAARQMFGFSILYLFMIFTLLIVDKSLSGVF